MLSVSGSHGRITVSSSLFLRLLHCSTSTQSTHFMVDYLVDSLRFSKQEAISASYKVRHLNSTTNSQSVIDFLRNYHFSETDIKCVVLSQPDILLRKVDKTLEPKFKFFSELGCSRQDLVTIIKRDPNLLGRSLHSSIIPAISFLRKILGSNEKIVKAIKRSYWPFYGKSFRSNVVVLEKYGASSNDIEKVIIRKPRLITQSPLRLQEKLIDLKMKLGIMPGSAMFSYGLSTICSQNKMNLQKKFELFKRFGWCESDICTIAKSQPVCFTHSEERLSKVLNFFMKEVGQKPSWLASHGSLLMYSLEKRVKPRYQVFKVLKEKGVISMGLPTILQLSEIDFLERVVERFKEEIPNPLYCSLTKKLKS